MITHGLIVVGYGHGILFIFLLEIVWFSLIGYLILLGQVCIVSSMFLKKGALKTASHITGLLLLWASVAFLLNMDEPYFVWLTATPFIICTVITLAGGYLKKLFMTG
jgi:hypothetical protein